MFTSFGSMNPYVDAEIAYRRENIARDFAAINRAAQQRADRRTRAAEARAAARPAPLSAPISAPVRRTWIAWLHRAPHPAAH